MHKQGQRVFDTECGEYGVIIRLNSETMAEVSYDHDWGCDSRIDTSSIDCLVPEADEGDDV